MRNRYAAAPGTELCTPGARLRLLRRRKEFVSDKIRRKTHYIHYEAAGNTTFEENILSHKMEIYLIRNEEEPEYHIFSENQHDFLSKDMLLYFHPCIRGRRQIRDMSVDFQKELTQGNRYLRQLLRGSKHTSIFLLQSVKFDGEDNGIPLTHIYSTRKFNPSHQANKNSAHPNTNADDIEDVPTPRGRDRQQVHRFDFVEVMYYDDDDRVQQTGMAQILAIFALNRKYRTKQVLFYIQWLQEDDSTASTKSSAANPRYLPFELLRYERVLDDYGRKSNTYQRQFIPAESINRPAFVIPTSVLVSDAHKDVISDAKTFLSIPYLFFNRRDNTTPTTYLRDADQRMGAAERRGGPHRVGAGGARLNRDFRFVLDSNAIPALSAFWLYNRRRYQDNLEEDESDQDAAHASYDDLQDVETEASELSASDQDESSSDQDESDVQNDEDILIEEEEAQEMQRLFED